MVVGFKMKIHPTPEQEEQLFNWCRISHDMWNFLVEKYKDRLPHTTDFGLSKYTPRDLMAEFGNDNVPQRVVLGVIKNFSKAVEKFFNKQARRPKFHKYDPVRQSFYFASHKLKIHDDFVYFPVYGRAGLHKKDNTIKLDKKYIDKIKITEIRNPRFTYYLGEWYISGYYVAKDVEGQNNNSVIGFDWGIHNFMTTSDGDVINYPKSVKREYQRIKKLQSIRSKKQKDSKNYKKLTKKMQFAFKRMKDIKRDFVEQQTTYFAKKANIVFEDLKDYSLRRNCAVRRQNMIQPRWIFFRQMEWKCRKFGTKFVKVDPAFTSQTCCVCGNVHKIGLESRVYICEVCGNVIDRDINAAINIKNRGIEILASNVCLSQAYKVHCMDNYCHSLARNGSNKTVSENSLSRHLLQTSTWNKI